MNVELNDKKPRLVKTSQGFSFFNIQYQNRLLYSKYNPLRSLEKLLENMDIMENTLLVIFSPGLFYGIDLIKNKIKDRQNIFTVYIELDRNLYDFSKNYISENPELKENVNPEHFYSCDDLEKLDSYVRKLCENGRLRRCVPLELSAGSFFSKETMPYVLNAITEIISVWWKNRITLQKMGRLFSKNIFRNIPLLKESLFLDDVSGTVDKTIIVCGAGESLDSVFKKPFSNRDDFYILAVDAAASNLISKGIVPDGIAALESQLAIEKCYIGLESFLENKNVSFFADISSRTQTALHFKNRIFFATEFYECSFLKTLKEQKIIPSFIQPLGSVGLAAFYIATVLRKNSGVKIYVCGLDFSYSAGITHADNTSSRNFMRISSSRKKPVENFDGAFNSYAVKLQDVNGKTVYSTPALLQYRQNFCQLFSSTENAFNAADSGLNLELKQETPDFKDSLDCSSKETVPQKSDGFFKQIKTLKEKSICGKKEKIHSYLQTELSALQKLKDLLEKGENSPYFEKDRKLSLQIKELALPREYLYFHFPDGWEYRENLDFLKRIKAETIYFTKIISTCTKEF